jgi:ferritin-like metal-binding protein YciE
LLRAAVRLAVKRQAGANVPGRPWCLLMLTSLPQRDGSRGTEIPGCGCSLIQGASHGQRQKSTRTVHETLKDIYFAEKKILSALPKMAKAALSEDLKAAFEKHETETEEHVSRLEKVFQEIDASPRGKTCDAIVGIIEEGQDVMKEFKGAPALDAGLLAAAQAVEHYEIARYGTLKTWAAELGLNQAVKLLETTLAEEKKTDETLTELAQSEVNQHARAA